MGTKARRTFTAQCTLAAVLELRTGVLLQWCGHLKETYPPIGGLLARSNVAES